MRVLVWSEACWPSIGGVQRFLVPLTAGLRAAGHDTAILTADNREQRPVEDELDGTPIVRVRLYEALASRQPDAILDVRRRTAAFIARYRPDVIHVNLLGPGAMLVADRTPGVPIVATAHGVLRGLGPAGADTLFGRAVRRARFITAPTRAALDSVLVLAPDVGARASVIPYGIDVPAREPIDPAYAPPRLLVIARLVLMKGVDVAIEAVARLRAEWPDVHLTIAGDGEERSRLEALARERGITDRVTFLGWQSPAELAELLASASLVIVPSREEGVTCAEGFGLVAIEAAAAARAVVASRSGGLPEVVIDGVTGVLVPPDDPAALAAAIAARLRDQAGTTMMGWRGRAHARRHYGGDACFRAYLALFLRAVEGI